MAGAYTFSRGQSYHHNLHATGGATDTLTVDSMEGRGISSNMHALRESARKLRADEDLVRAEEDDGAIRRQRPSAKAASVVLDKAEVAKLLHEAADDALTGRQKSRPDKNPSQRH